MHVKSKSFPQLLQGDIKYYIPVYQRKYSWETRHCRQLFEDLLTISETKKKHFFGSIVYASLPKGGSSERIIIDGQQRLTSVTLLYLAILHHFKENDEADLSDSDKADLSDKIWESFKDKESANMRIEPVAQDLEAFKALIYDDKDKQDPSSNFMINYNFFRKKLSKLPGGKTVKDIYAAIKKLEVIDIYLNLEDDDNPQLIFESLNSTGLALTEADKIRNFVLMNLNLSLEEQKHYHDKYWGAIEENVSGEKDRGTSEFVRDYLAQIHGRTVKNQDVYPEFKSYVQNKKDNIEGVLEDLLRYSQYFKSISKMEDPDPAVKKQLKDFNKLQMGVSYPYLLALYNYIDGTDEESELLMEVLKVLESYLARRIFSGITNNGLNKLFVSLHREVEKEITSKHDYADGLIYVLSQKEGSVRFPDDKEFERSFRRRNMFKIKKNYSSYLFDKLENGDSKENHPIYEQMANSEKSITIEHIMPQKLSKVWKEELGPDWEEIHKDWIDNIANLTITGYNLEHSNRSFAEKKTMKNGFKQSAFRLNHQWIAQQETWGLAQLRERQDLLWKKVIKLWPMREPKIEFSAKEKDISPISFADENAADIIEGKKINSLLFEESKYEVKSWADMMRKVVGLLFERNPIPLYRYYEEQEDCCSYLSSNNDIQEGYSGANHKLADNLYFNPNHNAKNRMEILTRIFDSYGIDPKKLIFYIAPDKVWPMHEPKTEFSPKEKDISPTSFADEKDISPISFADENVAGIIEWKKIKSLHFEEQEYEVKNWAKMMCKVVGLLFERNPAPLYRYYEERRGRCGYLSSNNDIQEGYSEANHKLADNLYFNPNHNAKYRMKILMQIFDSYGIDPKKLIFYIAPGKKK